MVFYDGLDDTDTIFYENNSSGWGGNPEIVVSNADIDRGRMDMAIDASEYVHICYRDDSAGDIYYTTNASGSWQSEMVYDGTPDNIEHGTGTCSIDVGSKRGVVHISYFTRVEDLGDVRHMYGSFGNWTDFSVSLDANPYNDNMELVVD